MADNYRWVLQLVDRCYGAASADDHWPALLKDISEFLDGCATTIHFSDCQLKPVDRVLGHNVSEEAVSGYLAHFHRIDVRKQRAVPGALNRIVTDSDLVGKDVVSGHEFYQDFLRPIGHRYVVSAVMGLDDGSYAFCSAHRGLKQDHADSEIVERARLLMPHLRRALQLRRRLSTVGAQGQAALELLDGLGQAVFMIDAVGRIIWQNASANRLLRQKDGLITSDGELRAVSTTDNIELQHLVKSAVITSSQPEMQPGGMTNISRPSLKRPYQVLATPLSTSPEMDIASRQLSVTPSAAIFVMDLDHEPVPHENVLRTLYNLTPAETRLAMAIGSGIALKDYAEKAELSVNYVRWLLKQVEAKTDTRRMTDLIRLLARQTGFFGATLEDGEGKELKFKRLSGENRKKK